MPALHLDLGVFQMGGGEEEEGLLKSSGHIFSWNRGHKNNSEMIEWLQIYWKFIQWNNRSKTFSALLA